MGYYGGRLAPWFDTAPNARFGRRAAHKGGQRLQRLVRARTPVHTGHLRDSIRQKRVISYVNERGERVYESGAETDVAYAPEQEHGWGLWGPHHAKYEIRPKKPGGVLHWIDPKTGLDVYATRVMHPGAPGAHMFAIGAAQTEAEFHEIVREDLFRWAKEVERQNKSDRFLGSRT